MNSNHNDTDLQAQMGKLLVVWVSTITGMTVTEWAALFACIYTLLQIYVLLRDKVFRKKED